MLEKRKIEGNKNKDFYQYNSHINNKWMTPVDKNDIIKNC